MALTLRMPRDSDLLSGPTGDDQGTSNAHESCYPREKKLSTYVGFGEDDQTPIVEADLQRNLGVLPRRVFEPYTHWKGPQEDSPSC